MEQRPRESNSQTCGTRSFVTVITEGTDYYP